MSDPNQEWQPPPPPPLAETTEPAGETMSTPATLTGIFFEPGRVFEALRVRPRFLIAGIILLILTLGVVGVLYLRVDMGEFIRDQMDKSSQAAQLSPEQKDQRVKIGKIVGAVVFPLIVPISIVAGAALYLVGVMAFGGTIAFKKALAVWVYSSLPPAVLGSVVAVLVLFLKAPETIDPNRLLITNPGAFMGADASPVLVTLLSQFDLLKFYGLFLAALGLRKVAKVSSGSAWGVVIGFYLIAAVLKIARAAIFGG
ncbi:MAG TPA: YIP1 family protein [Pyrinomonadaceae bacterium]|nr:YIP1 family protein [Pyrinomonadaceae bacterium]